MPPVFSEQFLPYIRRIGDRLSGHFIFQSCAKHMVEHVDFSLHGDKRIVLHTVPDGR